MLLPERYLSKGFIFTIDLFLTFFSLIMAYLIRFDFIDFYELFWIKEYESIIWGVPILLSIRTLSYIITKTHMGVVRHFSSEDVEKIFLSISYGTIIITIISFCRYYFFDGEGVHEIVTNEGLLKNAILDIQGLNIASRSLIDLEKFTDARRRELTKDEKASKENVDILLLQELFQDHYFCSTKNDKFFDLAIDFPSNPMFEKLSNICREKKISLPISFFQKKENKFFNSLVMIDSLGKISEVYHKSHIPEGPGYNEKYYFEKGNTGFMVFDTPLAKVGCAICWDQWFPECARILTLKGADLILYPSAIGSEPHMPELNSKDHWINTMVGHAAANQIPIITSNRIGKEVEADIELNFYGNSFILDHLGNVINRMNDKDEGIITATLDLLISREYRKLWGNFRDRRPDLYKKILDF